MDILIRSIFSQKNVIIDWLQQYGDDDQIYFNDIEKDIGRIENISDKLQNKIEEILNLDYDEDTDEIIYNNEEYNEFYSEYRSLKNEFTDLRIKIEDYVLNFDYPGGYI